MVSPGEAEVPAQRQPTLQDFLVKKTDTQDLRAAPKRPRSSHSPSKRSDTNDEEASAKGRDEPECQIQDGDEGGEPAQHVTETPTTTTGAFETSTSLHSPSEGCQEKQERNVKEGSYWQKVSVPMTTDLEQARAERLARNREVLKSLGLDPPSGSNGAPTNKRKRETGSKKGRSSMEPPPEPTKRYALRSSRRANPDNEERENEENNNQREGEEEGEVYMASRVHEHVEGKFRADRKAGRYLYDDNVCVNEIPPFSPTGIRLEDPALQRVYGMQWSCFNGLVSACGQGGRAAIFPLSEGALTSEGAIEPLVSWKAHNGWISDTSFVGRKMISAGNDKAVKLWDIFQSKRDGEPRLVTENASVHSNGVFSMDCTLTKILTGSKDQTTCLSEIGDDSIAPIRRFDGGHWAPIRAVAFQSENLLADGGRDRRVCIFDPRATGNGANVAAVDDAHDGSVNAVDWLTSCHLFTAGSDSAIRVWDVRRMDSASPMAELRSHCLLGKESVRGIYKPVPTLGSTCIATSGEGSGCLTLYKGWPNFVPHSGRVGFDPGTLHASSGHDTEVLLMPQDKGPIHVFCARRG